MAETSDPPASPDVGRLIERLRDEIRQIRELPSSMASSQLGLLVDIEAALVLLLRPEIQTEICCGCNQIMPAGWCGNCHRPTGRSAALIKRLRQMADEQNTRQQAVYGVADIKDAMEREDVLASAADALAALQARETEQRDKASNANAKQMRLEGDNARLFNKLADAEAKLKQAEAVAASLRQQVAHLGTQLRIEIDNAQRAEEAAEALRQAQARLVEALKVIHTSTRGDEHGQQWDIRKWLNERNVFNDDIQSSKRLVEAVCTFALASVDPLPPQEDQ